MTKKPSRIADCLHEDDPTTRPKFKVDLRKPGAEGLVLKLGPMFGNGRKQHPDAVTLIFQGRQGKSGQLNLRVAGIVGGESAP